MKNEIKYKVFEALTSKEKFFAFEEWLYNQKELADQINDELIYDLLTFNYKNSGSLVEFRKLVEKHFLIDEIDFYNVKSRLAVIINTRDVDFQLLNEFYYISVNYTSVNTIHTFAIRYEQLEYMESEGKIKQSLTDEMYIDAQFIYNAMLAFESNGGKLLSEFLENNRYYEEKREEEQILKGLRARMFLLFFVL